MRRKASHRFASAAAWALPSLSNADQLKLNSRNAKDAKVREGEQNESDADTKTWLAPICCIGLYQRRLNQAPLRTTLTKITTWFSFAYLCVLCVERVSGLHLSVCTVGQEMKFCIGEK